MFYCSTTTLCPLHELKLEMVACLMRLLRKTKTWLFANKIQKVLMF